MNAEIHLLDYVLPENQLSNIQLAEQFPDFSPEKISEKTGIDSRHIAGPKEYASDLALKAAKKILTTTSSPIDFILFNSQSPDYFLPTTACILQEKLGLPTTVGALDYNLGCSGYIYGLAMAKGLIAAGIARNILLLNSETYSKYLHPSDKSVRTLFGDGAAATLISASSSNGIGEFVLGTDGSGAEHLIVPAGGTRLPCSAETAITTMDESGYLRSQDKLYMNGPEIFNFTLANIPKCVNECLQKNELSLDNIDLFVFHQANRFMLDFLRKKIKIQTEKFYVNMSRVGNTVSASIPIALAMAELEGKLVPGMKIMLVGFGVGLSWGAVVVTWKS